MDKIDYRGIQPLNSNYKLYTPQSTMDQAYNIRNNTTKYTDTDYGFIDWAIDATHDFYRAVQKGEMDADADRILKANNDIQAAKDIMNLSQFGDDISNEERSEIIERLRKNGVWNKNSDPTDADLEKIRETIVNMPNYFADYITTVEFISMEEFEANHGGIPHGGSVIRTGTTGNGNKSNVEFSLKLDSNPEFTGSVLVSFARAAYRMSSDGVTGCKTIFDIPPALLSEKTPAELYATML